MAIQVAYWSIRGLGAPLRMMCEHVGVEYESVHYDCLSKDDGGWDTSSWFNVKPAVQAKNPLANLPYVEIDNVVVTQSNACMTKLGGKLDLLGATDAEKAEVEQLLCEVMDLRNACIAVFYGGDLEGLSGLAKHGSLRKLNAWLAQKGTAFLVGASPTAPDFHLWELLDQLKILASTNGATSWEGEGYSELATFYKTFDALPFMAAYKASPLYALPINNKMAKFGGTPDGVGLWDHAKPQTFDSSRNKRRPGKPLKEGPALDKELTELTNQCLQCITKGDWASYAALCAEDFTCFEPETSGRVVEGLEFHKHFFDYANAQKAAGDAPVTCTMSNVVVKTCGGAMGIVAYNRAIQKGFEVTHVQETRVWEKRDGKWLHTHFHKSA